MKFRKIPLIKKRFKRPKKKKFKWAFWVFILIILIIILMLIKIILFQKKTFYLKNEPFMIKKNLPNWNYTDIIKNYYEKLPEKYHGEMSHELWGFRKYMRLKYLSEEGNNPFDQKAKMELYHVLGGKKYSQLKNIYIMDYWKFGNSMIMLNNMIYYFEVLKEKKNIYLNPVHHWLIKDKIITEYVNLSLFENTTMIECNDNSTMCIYGTPWILTPIVIMPEIRLGLLKPEILKNLPEVKTSSKDLYIHFRSGDIFRKYYGHKSYSQPPLCFYKKVINENKFRKIYIISENKKNPVIDKLIEVYPTIIYNNGTRSEEISLLMNAYNLVGSVSSFLQVCLILNDRVENFYEYDIYRKIEKFRHLHHECYKYPRSFNIYQMKPSINYQNEMFTWLYTKNQVKLMLEEPCENSLFTLLKT